MDFNFSKLSKEHKKQLVEVDKYIDFQNGKAEKNECSIKIKKDLFYSLSKCIVGTGGVGDFDGKLFYRNRELEPHKEK